MAMTSTTTEPRLEDFTPFAAHHSDRQETSPVNSSPKPVLYPIRRDIGMTLPLAALIQHPFLRAFDAGAIEVHSQKTGKTESQLAAESGDASAFLQGLDIWVTSEQVTLFAPQVPHGVQIPYSCIGEVRAAGEGDRVSLVLRLGEGDETDGVPAVVHCEVSFPRGKDDSEDYVLESVERARRPT